MSEECHVARVAFCLLYGFCICMNIMNTMVGATPTLLVSHQHLSPLSLLATPDSALDKCGLDSSGRTSFGSDPLPIKISLMSLSKFVMTVIIASAYSGLNQKQAYAANQMAFYAPGVVSWW